MAGSDVKVQRSRCCQRQPESPSVKVRQRFELTTDVCVDKARQERQPSFALVVPGVHEGVNDVAARGLDDGVADLHLLGIGFDWKEKNFIDLKRPTKVECP